MTDHADLAAMGDEPLHPDLQPWVEDSLLGGRMLRHPLVYAVPLVLPGMANRMYEQKREQIAQAKATGDWHTYVWAHERPYRFDALQCALADGGDDWDLIADVWIDSENIWQHDVEWADVLTGDGHRQMMTDDEANRLDGLPDTVTIWRGCQYGVNEDGLSYTLDANRAHWFATRYARDDDQPVVIEATVPRNRIIALCTRRSEEEVIVLDKDVTIVCHRDAEGGT